MMAAKLSADDGAAETSADNDARLPEKTPNIQDYAPAINRIVQKSHWIVGRQHFMTPHSASHASTQPSSCIAIHLKVYQGIQRLAYDWRYNTESELRC